MPRLIIQDCRDIELLWSLSVSILPVFKLFVTFTLTITTNVQANSAPEVNNIVAFQRTDGSRIVDIRYDLADADGDTCTVTIQVSADRGVTWGVQAKSIQGAFGPGINPGPGKQILWDTAKDLPGAYGTDYRVKIKADDGKTPDDGGGTVTPPDLVLIPGGEFLVGDHHDSFSNAPIHPVSVSSFYMGRHEVTNAQYCAYLNSVHAQGLIEVEHGLVLSRSGESIVRPYFSTKASKAESQIAFNGSDFTVQHKSGRDMGNDPVVMVSWYGAAAYCNWRSQEEGLQACHNLFSWPPTDLSKKGYRLPTEAEWEYAARGGQHDPYYRFPWGDTIDQDQANYYSRWGAHEYELSKTNGYNSRFDDGVMSITAPVGSFPANGYGLFDVAGNVNELCCDLYTYYFYKISPRDDPMNDVGAGVVKRGGTYGDKAYFLQVALRGNVSKTSRVRSLGFRIVLDLD